MNRRSFLKTMGLGAAALIPVPAPIAVTPLVDPLERMRFYRAGLVNGFLSINDVRRAEGLEVLPNTDRVLALFGLPPESVGGVSLFSLVERRNLAYMEEILK